MTTTTSAPPFASDGTGKTLAGTQTAATQTTPVALNASHQKRKTKMIIRQISEKWYRLDTDGLVFFGYTREHVRHKLEAWVREHDLQRLR
jgi:hypothetical protein